jgi:hypothetical protein
MRIPGLPSTKARIIDRATAESWAFVEAKGVGGTRRLYELPMRYVTEAPVERGAVHASDASTTIVAGGKADMEKLALAIRALEEFAAEERITIDPERKSAIIAVLYDYLQKGAGSGDVANLLKLVG